MNITLVYYREKFYCLESMEESGNDWVVYSTLPRIANIAKANICISVKEYESGYSEIKCLKHRWKEPKEVTFSLEELFWIRLAATPAISS